MFVEGQFAARMRLLALGEFSGEQLRKLVRRNRAACLYINRVRRQTPQLIPRRHIIRRFAEALDDPRDARYTDHSYEEMLSQRIFQIACGYEDANDCNTLRHDPAFKAACGRLPLSDDPLSSQPSMSRFENAPRRRELYRMAQALFDTFAASYEQAPKSILLDIDDTADEVHGAQQQSLFNGYYDQYCYSFATLNG